MIQETPLPGNKQRYQQQYSRYLLADYDHGRVNRGAVDLEIVRRTIAELNRRSSGAIGFKTDLVETELSGGACTAVVLPIAKEVLATGQFAQAVNRAYEQVKKKNRVCSQQRTEIRSVQMAFNQITVLDRKVEDVAREKMSALASFYDLQVNYSTPRIEVDDEFNEALLSRQLRELQRGVYLLRLIQEADNEKPAHIRHCSVFRSLGAAWPDVLGGHCG